MKKSKRVKLLKILGPGIITGASDDDPSGIATYSQAGAGFGFSTLWTAWLTFPLMASMQEMCARIGLVTSSGLTGLLKRHYPKWLMVLMILFSFPAITLNIGADISAMGAVSSLLFPQVHPAVFSIFFAMVLLVVMIFLPYRRLANVLKWLCLALLSYLIVPFLVHVDWRSVLHHTVMPDLEFSKEYLMLLVGVLGTTVSPYMFFWQTNMEAEEKMEEQLVVDKKILSDVRTDVDLGMFFSCLVMFFVMFTTGSVLHPAGLTHIQTVEEAATALLPLAGAQAYLIFAFGIIGTGLLAVPVLAGSLSYIISEMFDWQEGLNKKFHEARGFYLVMVVSVLVAVLINFTGISPVQSLLYTAVLYGLTAPVIITIILHICNNRKIMGSYTNTSRSNILGIVTLLLMTVSASALLWVLITD